MIVAAWLCCYYTHWLFGVIRQGFKARNVYTC